MPAVLVRRVCGNAPASRHRRGLAVAQRNRSEPHRLPRSHRECRAVVHLERTCMQMHTALNKQTSGLTSEGAHRRTSYPPYRLYQTLINQCAMQHRICVDARCFMSRGTHLVNGSAGDQVVGYSQALR